MRIQKGSKTGLNNILNKILKMTVKAEEPPTGAEPTAPTTTTTEPTNPQITTTTQVNFEDLIANARKQEKEKLYPTITKLENEVKSLVEKNNAHLLTIGQKDARIQELEGMIEESKKSATKGATERETTLQKEVEQLKSTIADLQANTVTREAIEQEIKGEYEVKLYREQKLRECGDAVIPELIMGSTKEEIDASVKISQERYNQITQSVIGNVNVPVANANTSSFQMKDLKVEDIANLDPRSPEYAQLRAKLGLR